MAIMALGFLLQLVTKVSPLGLAQFAPQARVVTSRAYYGLYLGCSLSTHQAPYWIVDPTFAPAPLCRAEWLSPAMAAPGSCLPGARD